MTDTTAPPAGPNDYGAPPPPAEEEIFGADGGQYGATEPWTAPDDVDSIYGHTEAVCEPNGDDAAPLGDPFHKLPAPPLPRGLLPARSKNSCSFLIVVFEQGSRPFPESNGHVT